MNLKIFNSHTEKKKCEGKCGARDGCQNPAEEDHTCPYAEEINEDYESLCNCCSDCAHECAMDI